MDTLTILGLAVTTIALGQLLSLYLLHRMLNDAPWVDEDDRYIVTEHGKHVTDECPGHLVGRCPGCSALIEVCP